MIAPSGLTVRDIAGDGRHRLILSGELDIASAAILEDTVTSLCANGASAIVLDLSELTFMDSTGLRAVLAADRLCERKGQSLSVAGASGPVRRLFELTGVSGALRFESDPPGSARASGAAGS